MFGFYNVLFLADVLRVLMHEFMNYEMTIYRHHSLRVAVPSPRGKTGGRERLRKPDTNRVM